MKKRGKSPQTSERKGKKPHKHNHSPTPQTDQCPKVLWMMTPMEVKRQNPPPPSTIPVLPLSRTMHNLDYSICAVGLSTSGVNSQSAVLLQPSCWTGQCYGDRTKLWGEWEKEDALVLCKHCSATGKILACYQHWFSPSKQHQTGCCEWSYLHPSQTQYRSLGIQKPAEAGVRIALFWVAPE